MRLYRAVLSASATRMVEPSDEVMEKVNRWTARPHTASEVHIRGAIAANDQPSVDRRLRVLRAAIPALAELAVGNPMLRNHMTWSSDDLPVGRIFDGSFEDGPDGARRLLLAYYWPRTASGDEIAANVDSGTWREVSIGAYFGSVTCSICGDDVDAYCEHAPGKEYDGVLCTMDLGNPREFDELSFAWKGRLSDTETFAAERMSHPDAVDIAKLVAERAGRLERDAASFWDEFERAAPFWEDEPAA